MALITLNAELKSAIEEIAEVSGHLWEKGWAARNAGNVSLNVTELIPAISQELAQSPTIALKGIPKELTGHYFLVTVTGSRCRDVAREPHKGLLITRITDSGDGYQILWGGVGSESRPTNEFLPHLKIQGLLCRINAPQKAVAHSHPAELIALTHMKDYGEESFQRFLWSTHVAVKYFPEGIGMAPYESGGSEELADVTLSLFERHKAILWEKHGCTTIGTNATDAFDLIDILNSTARVFLLCKSAGYEPKELNPKQLQELQD
jgi:rhamnulose-1-phosphate aldolase